MARWARWVLAGMVVAACGDGAPAGGAAAGGAAPASGPAAAVVAEPTPAQCPEPRVPLAQRMGVRMAEICTKAASDPMRVDASLDAALSGAWKGEYAGGLASSTTRFDATLTVIDGAIGGTTTEPNTFGPPYYPELEATLTGDAYASRQVVMLKTYRTDSVDHSVLYVGRLDEAGTRIEGRWRVSGAQGTFWMERR